jgi:hypothetical protein
MRYIGFGPPQSLIEPKRYVASRRAWLVALVFAVAGLGCLLPVAASATITVSETPSTTEPTVPSCHNECEVIFAPSPSEAEGREYEGEGPNEGLTAKELRQAYNLPNTGGSASTVAVVDGLADPKAYEDLKTYRKELGLSECTEASGCFKQVNQKGEARKPTEVGGWSGEISLDLDMVSAACAECHILLVESEAGRANKLIADEEAAKLGATVITNSWNMGFERNSPANSNTKVINEECGSETACWVSSEEETTYDKTFERIESEHPGVPILFSGGDYGYGVRYPAIASHVVSVGGTKLTKEPESSRKWGEKVWSNPEDYPNVDEKGRGTGSGCSLYEEKPKWETDTACKKRIENDVAADADWVHSPVAIYDSYAGGWWDNGGTSASSPFVAGVEGLSTSHSRSLGAKAFWLAGSAKSLFDITEGSNGTCTPTEDDYWCTAEKGFDGPTGNGTPDGALAVTGAPVVTTGSVTEIKEKEATLHGTVNPEGAETKYYFEYGTTESLGSKTAEASAGSGTSNVEESKAITGLTGSTKYYYRIVATNTNGTTDGSKGTFSTTAKPVVETKPATSIGETEATLNGSVNPKGAETKYYFEYGTTESYGSKTAEASAGSGTSNVEESKAVTGLTLGTTYDFRIVATNNNGTTDGANQKVTPSGKPSVETKAATSVSETGATLNGSVNPKGAETKYYFEYGTTLSYGSKTAEVSAGSGISPLEENKAVTGLTASTTYDFRIVATNTHGTTYGSNQVFSTTGKPSVETKPATSVSETGATLNGVVNPRGAETKYYFEYGTTESYGTKTAEVSAGSGTTGVEENKTITGLTAGTEYYFRIVATNTHGTTDGSNQRFMATAWSVLEAPIPTGASASSLEGVSCTSSTACTAAGQFKNSSEKVVPLAERWSGTAWSVQEPPLPTGGTEGTLEGMSCTSSTACMASGYFINSSKTRVPLAESWNGTAWSAQEPPLPAGAKSLGFLRGISCTASAACTAAGYYENNSKELVPLAERWNGTAWSVQEPPSPTGTKDSYLYGVSCTSSTACTAVGIFVNSAKTAFLPLAERWNGTAWSVQEPPIPTGSTDTFLEGVSCTSSTACIATGYFYNSSNEAVPLAESWNGTAWSVQEPPIPTGAKTGLLVGVSCTSSTACVAVGRSENSSEISVPLAESWNGTAWSVQEPSIPTGATFGLLWGVSCTSSTTCIATGNFINSAGKEVPLAEDGS